MARKRRTRSPHPGIKLIRRARQGVTTWYARFVDPDTGKPTDTNLTKIGKTTAEARRDWAIRKSTALRERAAELALGAPRCTGGELGQALDDFLASKTNPATVETYREGVERFRLFAGQRGLSSVDDVHGHHVGQFRKWLRAAPRRMPIAGRGAGRGKRREGEAPVKATSVNNRLRSVKACLNWLRGQGRLPRVSAEAVREGLRALRADEDPPRWLRQGELRKLLGAALRHDADTFSLTRDEHDGLRPAGTTPRYRPIAPFVVAALLGGLREGELRRLTWDMVDLEARDDHGRAVGELRLPAAATKTKRARVVDLGVAPGLRQLLAALRLRSGGSGHVFPVERSVVEAARRRLVRSFGAPAFSWQDLRSTCESYHVNMPAFGAAAVWQAPLRVGNSPTIAQRFYVGLVRGIPSDARALEVAMDVGDLVLRVVRQVSGERDDEGAAGVHDERAAAV